MPASLKKCARRWVFWAPGSSWLPWLLPGPPWLRFPWLPLDFVSQHPDVKPTDRNFSAEDARPWYSCFTGNGVYYLLACPVLVPLMKIGEKVGLLPPAFADWFESLLIHPTVDFVRAGRLGIISGTVMMTWTKQ